MIDPAGYDTWIFDLDNTLYSAECALFAQIHVRMREYIIDNLNVDARQAEHLQRSYYVKHGTTMNGLMHHHNIAPDHFLDYVHDIDVSALVPNQPLRLAIDKLPGRKLIFTNGSVRHAENVTNAIGITDCFDGVFDIRAADYVPKPHRAPYEKFITEFDINPARAAMFEDMAQNLEIPHALGMTTILIDSAADWIANEPGDKKSGRGGIAASSGDNEDHIHHITDDLPRFLASILGHNTYNNTTSTP